MNVRVVALFVFLGIVGTGLSVHFRKQVVVETDPRKNTDDIPVPPKHGPFAKAVVTGEPLFDFGVMEQGQKGEHQFLIRNEGEAPLQLVARMDDHSCQCTVGSLGKNGLKPGEETTVTLKWEIKSPATQFQHHARVRTDDPNNATITFRVRGMVGNRLVLKPGTDIPVGTLNEGRTTDRTLSLYSEIVDAFKIEKIESSSPLVTVEPQAISAEELGNVTKDPQAEQRRKEEASMKEKLARSKTASSPTDPDTHAGHDHSEDDGFSGKTLEARSGYSLKVLFQPSFPVGTFRESITIHTDLESQQPVTVSFSGNRAGSLQVIVTGNAGWSPSEGVLVLRRFPAAEGKKAKALVFMSKFDQELEVIGDEVDPPTLKYTFKKNPNFKAAGREQYDLEVEVPPGKPMSYTDLNRGKLLLKTNHPEMKALKFGLDFTSY